MSLPLLNGATACVHDCHSHITTHFVCYYVGLDSAWQWFKASGKTSSDSFRVSDAGAEETRSKVPEAAKS